MENTQTFDEPAHENVPQAETTQPDAIASPEQTPDVPQSDADEFLTKIIEAAELRGYVKARNELARAAMAKPRLWENPLRKEKPEAVKNETDTSFLTHLTPNVWD